MLLSDFLRSTTNEVVAVDLGNDQLFNVILLNDVIVGVEVSNQADMILTRVPATLTDGVITTDTNISFTTSQYRVLGSGSPSPTVLSPLEFRSRFSLQEMVAIELARITSEDPVVRATIQVLYDNVNLAGNIILTDERTIFGVEYLVSIGLLTEARGDEILGR